MAIKPWQLAAIKYNIQDPQAWAQHAVNEKVFPDIESALTHKANRCAERMIRTTLGKELLKITDTSGNKVLNHEQLELDVWEAYAKPEYKDRKALEQEAKLWKLN